MRKFFFFDHLKLAKLSCMLELLRDFVISLIEAQKKKKRKEKKKPMPTEYYFLFLTIHVHSIQQMFVTC